MNRRTILLFPAAALAAFTLASTIPAKAPPSPGSSRFPVNRASQNFTVRTYEQMLANRRGTVAIAQRGTLAIASGVLIARDQVLTTRHGTHFHRGAGRRYEPAELDVLFDYDETLESAQRYPVIAYSYDSARHDFCLLRIGTDARGQLPDASRVIPLSQQPAALDAPVYVIHHPGGRPQKFADGATVLFPFRASQAQRSEVVRRAARVTPQLVPAIRASYLRLPDATYRNESLRWARQPTIGIDSQTKPGSSGAPVFDKDTGALLGILFAGSNNRASNWEHHEAVLPGAVIRSELGRQPASFMLRASGSLQGPPLGQPRVGGLGHGYTRRP